MKGSCSLVASPGSRRILGVLPFPQRKYGNQEVPHIGMTVYIYPIHSCDGHAFFPRRSHGNPPLAKRRSTETALTSSHYLSLLLFSESQPLAHLLSNLIMSGVESSKVHLKKPAAVWHNETELRIKIELIFFAGWSSVA